jgi:hypothetical protein
MLAERKHFPQNAPGILLVDIANQSAVADVFAEELRLAAEVVAVRSNSPVCIGAVRSPIDSSTLANPERRTLRADSAWATSRAGSSFLASW